MRYKKVLIAVDDSKYSKRAAEKGVELARELEAEMAFIYVVSPVYTMGSVDAGILPNEAEEIETNRGEKMLEELISQHETGLKTEASVVIGKPAEEILIKAEAWGADLIVIGRHGLESFSHLVFGGVVDEVAKHTHIPVLLVPYQH